MTIARKTTALLLLAAALLSGGCIKVRITVQLNEDGTGQLVEDLVFGEKLVDAAKRMKNVPSIDELTSDETIKKRLAHMGKGVSFVGKKVEKQPDGSVRLVTTYSFEDISNLRIASFPFGAGWEDTKIRFTLRAPPDLLASYHLTVDFERPKNVPPAVLPPLSELEAQQVRQLLPIFKDMLQGFELKIRLEVYDPKKWASTQKGHLAMSRLGAAGGQLTIFHLTDKHMVGNDDGLMLVVPWRQVGRELDLEKGAHYYANAPQLLPHLHYIDRGAMNFQWRAIQTPRGREYY
jgi:hypothetical protein